MARIRTIKPEFFLHEELFDLEQSTGLPVRLAFAGLWTQCDREGRFLWRPRVLKTQIMPWDDVDFSKVLDALHSAGFVKRYEFDGKEYGYIPSWKSHQTINLRESESRLPDPEHCNARANMCMHVHARGEGKGRERKGREKEECNTDVLLSPDGDSSTLEDSPNSHPTPEPARTPKAEFEITIPPALDTPEFRDAWKLWKKHRTEIRKPLKPTQQTSQINLCVEWGLERALAALKHTMAMGWQGLREPDATTVAKNSEFQF